MSTAADPYLLAPGATFAGRYQVVGSLGRTGPEAAAGAAVVYLVRELETGERRVLRLLRRPPAPARLAEDEVRLRQLGHRNLVRVLASGSEPVPHVVLEHVALPPAAAALAALAKPARQPAALSLLTQTLDLLAALREQGVVHGRLALEDLRFGRGLVKVIDPGLAWWRDDPGSAPDDPRAVLASLGALVVRFFAPISIDDGAGALAALRQRLTESDLDLGFQDPHEALAFLHEHGLAPYAARSLERTATVLAMRPAGAIPLFRPRLLARDPALSRVVELLTQVREQGAVGLVLVPGAPGCGRSRLLDAMRDRARTLDFDTHLTTCHGEEYAPWGDLHGFDRSLVRRNRRGGSGDGSLSALRHVVAFGRLPEAGAGGDPGDSRRSRRLQALSGFHRVFSRLFAERGQFLAFDDWHRAEPRAVELIEMLLERKLLSERRPRRGVVLVFSYEREGLKRNSEADQVLRRLRQMFSPLVLQPTPLDRDDSSEVIRSMTGISAPAPALVDWLHRAAEGVPRRLVEAIAVLDDRGHLGPLALGQVRVDAVEPLPPLGTNGNLITGEWRRLGADERWLFALLRTSRCAADEVRLAAAAQLSRERVRRALARLLHLGVVEMRSDGSLRVNAEAAAPPGGDETESSSHLRWIAVLEPLARGGRDNLLAPLAEHADAAGDVVRLAGCAPGAITWLARMHQLGPALALAERCRRRLAAAGAVDAAVEARLAVACGGIHEQLGDHDDAWREYRQAVDACVRLRDGGGELDLDLEVRAWLGLAAVQAHRGDGEAADAGARAALRGALASGDPRLLADAYRLASRVAAVRGDWRKSLGLAVKARRAALAASDPVAESAALVQMGSALLHRGKPAAVRGFLVRARELAEHARDDRGQAAALVALGTYYWWSDELVLARATHEAAVALRERIGNRPGLAYSLQQVGILALELGDHAACRERLLAARETFVACRYQANVAIVDLALAECALRAGDRDEARQRARAVLAAGVEGSGSGEALQILARIAAAEGAREESRELARQALASARASGFERGEAWALLLLARAGEDHHAELRLALDRAERSAAHELVQHLGHHLGRQAETRDEPAAALALYDRALAAVHTRARHLGRQRWTFLSTPEVQELVRDRERCAEPAMATAVS